MSVFIVREMEGAGGTQILLSLRKLVERLEAIEIWLWSLRDIDEMRGGADFFQISILDVERLSSAMQCGLMMTDSVFREFLKEDFQIIDGFVDCYLAGDRRPSLQIQCVDSGQWVLSTASERLALRLAELGFRQEK